jgi:penicillin-binding protein 1A
MDVGFEPVIKLANNMGIKSTLKDTYSLALGAWEVTLLELTNAYGTFANQGEFVQAHGITRVLNSKGDVVYQAKFTPKRALDKDSAAITTWMLENVVQNGTGSPAALSRHPVAGKTGTSEEARDLWFVGYTPQIVTGVWLGNDNNDPTWGQSTTAAYNWGEFMQEVTKNLPVKEFPKAPDFYDRKPTIKAKRVEPKWVSYGEIGPNGTDPNDKPEGSAWDNSESAENNYENSYEN